MAHTGLACPTCDAGGKINALVTNPGVFGYHCTVGHVFSDTEELLAMNPRKIAVPVPVKKPQEGLAEFKIALPSKLIDAIKARFGEKLTPTVTLLFAALLDSDSFVVTGLDIERLQAIFGEKVTNPAKLVGAIQNIKTERDEARREAETYKSGAGGGAGGVAVNEVAGDFVQLTMRISIDDFTAIKDKAKFNSKTPVAYMQEIFSQALANGWF